MMILTSQFNTHDRSTEKSGPTEARKARRPTRLHLGAGLAGLATALTLTVAIVIPAGHAAFPGANGKIAFVRSGEIYVMNSNGTGQTKLTTLAGPAGDDTPAWSPDGTKIAFTSDIGNQEIYVMNADGSGQTNLTQNAASDRQPTWSPDGTKIAFLSNRSGDFEIWSINANGSSPTNLTMTPGIQEDPAWAPDNTKIAYRQPVDLFTMDPSGTNQALFPLAIGPSVSQPDWSPDAQKIAFTGDIPGVSTHIYVVNANATGVVTQLTSAGQGLNFVPAYSPDGTKIAFTSNRDGNYEIYVMNADGTSQANLTQNVAGDTSPDWQPDVTPPTITITTPPEGAVYALGQVVLADYACEDEAGGSGLASCVGDVPDGTAIDTASVGAKTFTVNAADNAGNPASATHTYSVVYNFSGFFPPVDNLPTLNAVKAGSAIPVKFSLSGFQGLDIFAAGYPKSQMITCSSTAPVDGIEETVTAGSSSLSYDATLDQYTYVWKTLKSWAGTCRQLVVKLNDNTVHRANFMLK